MHNKTSALVVEGGAMRGIFAAGVLDSFLDNQFFPFDFCIGVSAGSTNLAAYLTGQRGRSHKIITDYSIRPDFINAWKFIKGQHLIDLDWLWDIAYKEYRLDTFALANQSIPLWVVTTNCETGEAEYHEADEHNLEDLLLASCAVPFAYRDFPVFAGAPQTDGGVADSLPVIEAYNRGARHITVVLSQQRGYRKQPIKFAPVISSLLRRYPSLTNAMRQRHTQYNAAIDFIENPPKDCTVEVLAPSEGFEVSRLTKDPVRLNFGYEMGLLQGQALVSHLLGPDHNEIQKRSA